LIRASAVVNCQSIPVWEALRRSAQALGLVLQDVDIGDASGEALFGQDAQFDLGHVEPAAVFGGVADLQAIQESPRLFRREGFVQRGRRMGDVVVPNQHDFLGVRVADIHHCFDLVGQIERGLGLSDADVTSTLAIFA